MNRYKKIHRTLFVSIIIFAGVPFKLSADSGWSYHQQVDSLNNQTYSYAQSPLPKPGLYDNIMLSIVCKDHKLQSLIETDELIASQGSSFSIEYQVDQQTPITLSLKTLADSKRKGYTETDAKQMATALLSGQAVFIKVNTMIKTTLSSSISLDNARSAIDQVMADCNSDKKMVSNSENNYNLNDFENAFKKLSANQQQQILTKLKQLVIDSQ